MSSRTARKPQTVKSTKTAPDNQNLAKATNTNVGAEAHANNGMGRISLVAGSGSKDGNRWRADAQTALSDAESPPPSARSKMVSPTPHASPSTQAEPPSPTPKSITGVATPTSEGAVPRSSNDGIHANNGSGILDHPLLQIAKLKDSKKAIEREIAKVDDQIMASERSSVSHEQRAKVGHLSLSDLQETIGSSSELIILLREQIEEGREATTSNPFSHLKPLSSLLHERSTIRELDLALLKAKVPNAVTGAFLLGAGSNSYPSSASDAARIIRQLPSKYHMIHCLASKLQRIAAWESSEVAAYNRLLSDILASIAEGLADEAATESPNLNEGCADDSSARLMASLTSIDRFVKSIYDEREDYLVNALVSSTVPRLESLSHLHDSFLRTVDEDMVVLLGDLEREVLMAEEGRIEGHQQRPPEGCVVLFHQHEEVGAVSADQALTYTIPDLLASHISPSTSPESLLSSLVKHKISTHTTSAPNASATKTISSRGGSSEPYKGRGSEGDPAPNPIPSALAPLPTKRLPPKVVDSCAPGAVLPVNQSAASAAVKETSLLSVYVTADHVLRLATLKRSLGRVLGDEFLDNLLNQKDKEVAKMKTNKAQLAAAGVRPSLMAGAKVMERLATGKPLMTFASAFDSLSPDDLASCENGSPVDAPEYIIGPQGHLMSGGRHPKVVTLTNPNDHRLQSKLIELFERLDGLRKDIAREEYESEGVRYIPNTTNSAAAVRARQNDRRRSTVVVSSAPTGDSPSKRDSKQYSPRGGQPNAGGGTVDGKMFLSQALSDDESNVTDTGSGGTNSPQQSFLTISPTRRAPTASPPSDAPNSSPIKVEIQRMYSQLQAQRETNSVTEAKTKATLAELRAFKEALATERTEWKTARKEMESLMLYTTERRKVGPPPEIGSQPPTSRKRGASLGSGGYI